MELHFYLSLIFLLLLLYWSAWISSAETALFSLSPHTVKTYQGAEESNKQLIAKLLSHPRDLLVTVFMINTFINIVLQNVASDMFGKDAGLLLKIGVPLVLTLIFGEIVPKYIGLQNNLKLSLKVAPTLNKLQNNLTWIRKATIAVTTPISRIMFFFLKKEEPISPEEIEHILETSKKHGVVQKEEADLLEGLLELQNSEVKELMWPKEDILFYSMKDPLSKLIHLFVDESRTRIPVCDPSLDNVLGIITSVSFFKYQGKIQSSKDLLPLLEKPFFSPETTSAKALLRQMDEKRQVLALLVDEYGSLVGIISREDLIEVVVGRIENTTGQKPAFTPAGKNEVICSGKWELSEFNEYFDVNLVSENHLVTIGGYLIEEIGDIPKVGTRYETPEFLFQVLSASKTRVNRLFIRKLVGKRGWNLQFFGSALTYLPSWS